MLLLYHVVMVVGLVGVADVMYVVDVVVAILQR